MARTAAEISNAIRAQLGVLDPDISAEPLSPERKIIDTVSEVMAEASVDQYVLNYQFDIDTKTGADLDRFVALFGFARQAGRRATGTVTFTRATPSPQDVVVPAGTQVVKPATRVSAATIFQTTLTATLFAGDTTTDAPVECTAIGPIGNVPANTISIIGTGTDTEFSSISNAVATSGGTDEEDDNTLRVRFKNTIFRNISGTRDQYLALSIASRFADKANVIGPISRFIEYIQVTNDTPTPGNLGAVSQIPYSKYTYGFDYYLTDGDLATETFYTPNAIDYTFNNTVPPTITVNNRTSLPTGTVLLLEHSYCSANSRNYPATGLANYVDVYVSGNDIQSAFETAVLPDSSHNIVNTVSSLYYTSNYVRAQSGAAPTMGNRFQELLWQPVVDLPDSIIINNRTYYQNIDYWLLRDVTLYQGSHRARNGIEWSSASIGSVTPGTAYSFSYMFNLLPATINQLIDAHRQVTSDALVHAARQRLFNVNLLIMYAPGYSQQSVDVAISTRLTDFLSKQQFGAIIQVSDLLDIAHQTPGVDNVRLVLPSDGAAYGIQEVAPDGVTPVSIPYISDFALQDSDLPVLNAVQTVQRSQNTWSS